MVLIVQKFTAYTMSLLFCPRGHFEEMCADILARVEPPLQSLLEQASE